MPEPAKDDEKIAFLRNLYRNESAYSDEVRVSRLRELNVTTRLDDVIRKVVQAGGSVVITGNAGDGKTHTIRLLEKALRDANAKIIVDASVFTHEECFGLGRRRAPKIARFASPSMRGHS